MPDLAEPTPPEQRTIFEKAVNSLTVARGRGKPLAERVALQLAA
jgi:hypothetical protein